MSDKELVRCCQADSAAFEELVRRYRRAVFAYARTSTGSHQDAEEVTQDVFVKIYRAAHRFNSKYSFTTWLYKITSNTCKNKLRGHRHPAASLDDEDSPVVPVSQDAGPLEVYRKNIAAAEVRDAIAQLPVKYRQVLHLRYVDGLSYREIADVLGLSLGNVEARIFRGKERVRLALLRHGEQADGSESRQPGGL